MFIQVLLSHKTFEQNKYAEQSFNYLQKFKHYRSIKINQNSKFTIAKNRDKLQNTQTQINKKKKFNKKQSQ